MILICGGIGAGKSVVSRIIRLRGHEVLDCDYEARLLMEHDKQTRAEVQSLLGPEAYFADGSRNRAYISERVFGNPALLESLNAIVHGRIRALIRSREEECGSGELFVECAIPTTSGISEMASEIWYVTAADDERISRVMARSLLSAEQVRSRIQVQQREYRNLPAEITHIIANDGSKSLLLQIEALIELGNKK